jgi:restriction endonuclease Mrr
LKPFFHTVNLTKGSGDGGVDIIVRDYNNHTYIVQCKAHKHPIGPEPVRALIGVMKDFGAEKAIFIALGGFTPGAKEISNRHPLYLMDINDVIKMGDGIESNKLIFAGLVMHFSV